jgi:hypothetical protein
MHCGLLNSAVAQLDESMVTRKRVVLARHLRDLDEAADLARELGAGEMFEEG